MIKSPLGVAFVAAAVILSVSPDARKTVRKWAVKGTELLLELTDQVKMAAAGIGSQRESAANNAMPVKRHDRLQDGSFETTGMEAFPMGNVHNALSDEFMKNQLGTLKM
ncbi:hypothetical protein G3578_11535 [Brevibacillus sp. SYP-B805]|uniref:hypothetical protein n=1 Tax=Brevibacillus sp. SYP-B805 TaxID=1578199 RepID=UPI0013EA6796|nr:hypothetical protein [Brevibacillus sp. SYP-B805]NGQ95786.1 hypothetical protein [Brevibacillus sp. SYP-B805]